MWSALPKNLKCILTLFYSPCDDTPTTATVLYNRWRIDTAVYRKGEYGKNIFCKLLAILHLSFELRWQQWEFCHMVWSAMSLRTWADRSAAADKGLEAAAGMMANLEPRWTREW